MNKTHGFGIAALVLALFTAGCDQLPGAGGSSVLTVDLSAIAKATGQEQAIQQQAQAAREELNAQLMEQAASLESQLKAEQDKLGENPSEEQQQQLQQLALQVQQQYGQLQAQAQQQAQQIEVNLILEFREQVKPYAEKIARTQNASVVMLLDQSTLWQDPGVDITDELIGELRAAGAFDNAAGTSP